MKKRTITALKAIAIIILIGSIIAIVIMWIRTGGERNQSYFAIPVSVLVVSIAVLIRLGNIPVEEDDPSVDDEEENYPILQDPFTIEVGTVKQTSYEDENNDFDLKIRYCGTLNDRFVLTASIFDDDIESRPSFFPMPDLVNKASSSKETTVRISDLDSYTITIKVYEITPTHIKLQVINLEEDEE